MQATALGNTTLVNHGIQTEQSDIRAHVGVVSGHVYAFSTRRALDVINAGNYNPIPVKTKFSNLEIVTAKGYAVRIDDLTPRVVPASMLIKQAKFSPRDSTTEKGRKAQEIIERLLRQGLFPLPISPVVVEDVDLQHNGFDLIVSGRWRIEVKCDWRAGKYVPSLHGDWRPEYANMTGNIFLQIAECNPMGYY